MQLTSGSVTSNRSPQAILHHLTKVQIHDAGSDNAALKIATRTAGTRHMPLAGFLYRTFWYDDSQWFTMLEGSATCWPGSESGGYAASSSAIGTIGCGSSALKLSVRYGCSISNSTPLVLISWKMPPFRLADSIAPVTWRYRLDISTKTIIGAAPRALNEDVWLVRSRVKQAAAQWRRWSGFIGKSLRVVGLEYKDGPFPRQPFNLSIVSVPQLSAF